MLFTGQVVVLIGVLSCQIKPVEPVQGPDSLSVQSRPVAAQAEADDADSFTQDLLFTALIGPPTLLVGLGAGAGVWFLGQALLGSALLTVVGAGTVSLVAGAMLGFDVGGMLYAVSAVAQLPVLVLDPLLHTEAQVNKELDKNFWTYLVATPIVSGLAIAGVGALSALAVSSTAALPVYWGGLAVFTGLVSAALCLGLLWDPLEDFVE